MKSSRLTKSSYTLKYSCAEFWANNKFKIIVCLLFALIGLLTGIFTAIKIFRLDDSDIFKSFNLTYQLSDLENFSANFFGRLISYEIVNVLLLIFSIHASVNIFGWCLIAYRTFLISINCVMIVLNFSFNGIIKALIVILPCQLIMMLILIIYFCYMCDFIKKLKYCKNKNITNLLIPLIISGLALSVINIVETLLLYLFKSSVILVI